MNRFVKVRKLGWLTRSLDVMLEYDTDVAHVKRVCNIEYYGWGLGYEKVSVDGQAAAWSWSWLRVTPKFDFDVGPVHCTVQVRVWPWLRIRAFALSIDGRMVYAEGRRWKKQAAMAG